MFTEVCRSRCVLALLTASEHAMTTVVSITTRHHAQYDDYITNTSASPTTGPTPMYVSLSLLVLPL